MGCDGCEVPGEFDCPHRQFIYHEVAHTRAWRELVDDPSEASTGAWVAKTKVSEGAVAVCLLFASRTRSGGLLNTVCNTSTLTHQAPDNKTSSDSKIIVQTLESIESPSHRA